MAESKINRPLVIKDDSESISFDSTYGLGSSAYYGYQRKILSAWTGNSPVRCFQASTTYRWNFVDESHKGQTATVYYYYVDA